MRKVLGLSSIGLTVGLLLPAIGASASDSSGRAAAARCSRGAAQAVLREHPKLDPWLSELPGQVLCGAFLGPGSQAMVVSFAAETCGGDSGWVVFRLTAGAWRLVWRHRNGQLSIAAVGSGIKETLGILRPTDPRCEATGGTRSRIWQWNGSKFIGGHWKVTPAPSTPTEFYARPKTGTIVCAAEMAASKAEEMVCQSRRIAPDFTDQFLQVATLPASGDLVTCTEQETESRCPLGDAGEHTPTYPAGKQITLGGFICKVLDTGVECTVIASGKGFLITTERVTPVGT